MRKDTRPKVEKSCVGAEEAVVARKSAKADGVKGGKIEPLKRNQHGHRAVYLGNAEVSGEIGEPYEARVSRTVL